MSHGAAKDVSHGRQGVLPNGPHPPLRGTLSQRERDKLL